MLTSLIMAGGEGKRLWPLSNPSTPKHLLSLKGDKSLLKMTVERIKKLVPEDRIFIVTGEIFADITRKDVPEIPYDNFIIEPMQRDTSACVGLGSIKIASLYEESVTIVLPADQYITKEDEYLSALSLAVRVAKDKDMLVTIGAIPTYPATGYGYLHIGEEIMKEKNKSAYKVLEFVEKPNLETAKKFFDDGHYLQNMGVFIWKTSNVLTAFRKYMPNLYEGLLKIKSNFGKPNEKEVLKEVFEKLEKKSIDYGIMEKADNVATVAGDFGWNDIGTWDSLEKIYDADSSGNIIIGSHKGLETNNSIIVSKSNREIRTYGIKDIIIIDGPNGLLVCHKDKAGEIKRLS